MRILAIGDIHGCYTAFEKMLKAIKIQPDDLIITLGDYVDRGPDSKKVIDKLIKLEKTGQLIALKGNHEVMMLEAVNSQLDLGYWLNVGGRETLDSYSKQVGLVSVPDKHWNFIENVCLDYWETENHFFVHANVEPNLPLEQQKEEYLFWRKFYRTQPHFSGKTMICGHTSQKDGLPFNLGYAICIDTWVYDKGWLTCLDVTTGQVWQTNQKGKLRTAFIDEFETLPKVTALKEKQYSEVV